MKEFLKKELYSFRAVAAILARWLLLAVPTGLVCGAVGTAFHLAVEHVTEWRAEHIWLLWLLPVVGLAIVALYKVTGCEGMGTNNVIRAVHSGESVSPLLVPAIFFGTVLTHLCGGSAGREGAALQMGGSIGYNIAKLFRFSAAQSAMAARARSRLCTVSPSRPAIWTSSTFIGIPCCSRRCSARRCRRLSSASWWRTWASRSRWPLSPASPPPSSPTASRWPAASLLPILS